MAFGKFFTGDRCGLLGSVASVWAGILRRDKSFVETVSIRPFGNTTRAK